MCSAADGVRARTAAGSHALHLKGSLSQGIHTRFCTISVESVHAYCDAVYSIIMQVYVLTL
jgi:hypothetical protein